MPIHAPTDTVLAVAAMAEANAALMQPQGLANCTWALSKLVPTYRVAASCIDTLAVHIMNKLEDMQPQHLSNVLLAWGHLEQYVVVMDGSGCLHTSMHVCHTSMHVCRTVLLYGIVTASLTAWTWSGMGRQ